VSYASIAWWLHATSCGDLLSHQFFASAATVNVIMTSGKADVVTQATRAS
jgi:hypothetical protein